MYDDRSQLFREYLRIVEGLMPKWVVMENVTGITSVGQGAAVQSILKGLKNLGYQVETKILRAEEYGIPQERRRIVFLANRTGQSILWPEQSHGVRNRSFVTIADAISDLPVLVNGQDSGVSAYAKSPQSEYQRLLRGNNTKVYNHAAPRLAAVNMQRMQHIPPGGSWRDIPVELLPAGMKKARRCDHTKRYGRMSWGGLSCTILTKCDLHWGAYLHPDQDRSITVREAARIQSFPDWFQFEGPRTEQYVQVGNAVPPILGKTIGKAIQKADSMYEAVLEDQIAATG
jgi:DNA (cytosine-5)-methyltransferase 1